MVIATTNKIYQSIRPIKKRHVVYMKMKTRIFATLDF